MFVENKSATSHLGILCKAFEDDRVTSCDQVQRGLYWYNGARAAGYMAIPPILRSASMLLKGGACTTAAAIRAAWGRGNGDSPDEGTPQAMQVGDIPVPTLF